MILRKFNVVILLTLLIGWNSILSQKSSSIRVKSESIDNPETVSSVNISANPQTISVSDSVYFYDDGGKSSKCTLGFKGQISFKPSNPNKKIMLLFRVFDIFNTSSVNYNDIFKVYNGLEVNDANFIGEYLNNPKILKSTSSDGSITVSFEVKTGIPKEGWEIVVKEFTPVQMQMDSIVCSQNFSSQFSSGVVGGKVMKLKLSATNTMNELNVQKLIFNTKGSTDASKDIAKATVLFSGLFDDFSKATKIASVDKPSNSFEIEVNQKLKEGNNYFWLAYDLNENAINGDLVDAVCDKVIVENTEYLPKLTNPIESFKVDNVFRSSEGNSLKTIFGEWKFTDDNKGSGGKYSGGTLNQIVTFIPFTEKNKIQLDFEKFDLYYSSTSYGAKSKFEVYSGREVKSENLIWKLDNATYAKTGPQKPMRSKLDDGAITVLFNPVEFASNYTSNGWDAVVKEYIPSNIEVKDVLVSQASTETVKPGQKDVQILSFNIKTSGELDELNFSELLLGTKLSGKNISNIRICYTSSSNLFNIASVFASSENTSTDLIFNGSQKLNEGNNYFWVVADIADDAKTSAQIDFEIKQLVCNSKKIIVEQGNPDGERIVVNELLMSKSAMGERTIDESLMFYDDGGKIANHSNSFTGSITFVPKEIGKAVRLNFKSFEVEKADKFEVYSGKTIDSQNLLATVWTNTIPEYLISNSDDGALTIRFISDKSVNKKGWEIEVLLAVPTPLQIDSVFASQPNLNSVVRGSKGNLLMKVMVSAKGDKGIVNLSSLKFRLKGYENINSISLFSSQNKDIPLTKKAFGTKQNVESDEVTFNDNIEIKLKGKNYLWLLADLKNESVPNSPIDAILMETKFGDVSADIIQPNPDGERTIKSGVKGEYFIGNSSKANFKTFKEAIDFIKEGIEGNTYFYVENGEYKEIVKVPHIEGTSANSQIYFKSLTGNADDVVICYDTYTDPGYGNPAYGVFNINGADFINIENITLTTNDTKFESVIMVNNISRNVKIKGNKIYSAMTTDYSNDIALLKMVANNIEDQNNDYITIENNTFEGGYIGIYVGGTGYVDLPKEVGATIKGNTFLNQGSKSIYIPDEADVTIEKNKIFNDKSTKSGFQGIDLYRLMGNSTISKNNIVISKAPAAIGIELRPASGNDNKEIVFSNNVIALTNATSTESGIIIGTTSKNLGIYYNTININGKAPNSRAISIGGKDILNVNLKYNILNNKADGACVYVNKDTYQSAFNFKKNAYYSSLSKIALINTLIISTYPDWKLKANDDESIIKNVDFYSNSDLHLKNSDELVFGQLLENVNEDIDGDKRALQTCVGADEYNAPDLTAPIMLDGFPTVKNISHNSSDFVFKINESGKIYCYNLLENEQNSSVDQIKAKGKMLQVNSNQEVKFKLESLAENKTYRLYYVLEDVFGNTSDILNLNFKTIYRPTEISDFEQQPENAQNVEDGTALFNGFKVVKGIGANQSNQYISSLSESENKIVLTNTDDGISVNGVFIRSKSDITINGFKSNGEKKSSKIAKSTNGQWQYLYLLDLGEIKSLNFECSGNTFELDEFSGIPNELTFGGQANYTAKEGETLELKSLVSGGANPISFEWENIKTQEIFTQENIKTVATSTTKYLFKATDAFGQELKQEILVIVEGNAVEATFEDLNLKTPETYWMGDDASGSGTESCFYSGSYKFNNYYSKSYSTWGGFGYSNKTSTDFTGDFLTQQFNSAVGLGAKDSKTYGVLYAYGFSNAIEVTNNPDGEVLNGTFIANAAWVKNVVLNGDDMTGAPFKQGDWIKVTATGYNNSGKKIASTDFYLADYLSSNPDENYLVNDWCWWDLSSLGNVKMVRFTFDASRKNNYGVTVPAYFCLDNFNGKDIAPYVKNPIGNIVLNDETLEIDLSKVFVDDDAPKSSKMKFKLNSETKLENLETSLSDNVLTLKPLQKTGKSSISIKAISEGRSVSCDFTAEIKSIATSINNTENQGFYIYPTIVKDNSINIISDSYNCDASIYDVNGILILKVLLNSNKECIDVSSLKSGVYFIKVKLNNGHIVVNKFIKQ